MNLVPLRWSSIVIMIAISIPPFLLQEQRKRMEELESYVKRKNFELYIKALRRDIRYLTLLLGISFSLPVICFILGVVYFSILSQMNEVRLFVVTLLTGIAFVIAGLFISFGLLPPAYDAWKQYKSYLEKVRL